MRYVDEIAALALPEPPAGYRRKFQAPSVRQGRQSDVTYVESWVTTPPSTYIWKRMAVGKGLTPEEARVQFSLLGTYRKQLKRLGWPTPEILYLSVRDDPSGSYIDAIEQFIDGVDSETLFTSRSTPDRLRWRVVDNVLSRMGGLRLHRLRRTIGGVELHAMPCGVDLKPSNLVYCGDSDRICLVDTFAPQVFRMDRVVDFTSKLTSFSPEMLLAVCGTREGALLRFWRLLESQWPVETIMEFDRRREEFGARMKNNRISTRERKFIESQIRENYPWLDNIYLNYKQERVDRVA